MNKSFLHLLLGFIGLAATSYYCYSIGKEYKHSLTFEILAPPQAIFRAEGYFSAEDFVYSQYYRFISSKLCQAVVKELQLNTRWKCSPIAASNRLNSSIHLQRQKGTNVLMLSVKTDDAELSRQITQSLLKHYQEQRRVLDVQVAKLIKFTVPSYPIIKIYH